MVVPFTEGRRIGHKGCAHRQKQNWKLTQKKLFLFFMGAQSATLIPSQAPPRPASLACGRRHVGGLCSVNGTLKCSNLGSIKVFNANIYEYSVTFNVVLSNHWISKMKHGLKEQGKHVILFSIIFCVCIIYFNLNVYNLYHQVVLTLIWLQLSSYSYPHICCKRYVFADLICMSTNTSSL